jgi:alkylation response protein AidB-like acyl-CoA dehydrogenase
MHKDLRKRIRTWAQREIYPNLEQWAEGEVEVPPEMFLKVGAAGFLALCVGKPWPREWYPDVSVAGL